MRAGPRSQLRSRHRVRLRARLAALAGALAFLAGAVAAEPSDRAVTVPAPYDPGPPRSGGVVQSSHYLPMRDGTRIAVDLYLPGDLGPEEKLPAILHQTRYWRAAELRFPFTLFGGEPDEAVGAFVSQGYAWISADARGSGASFGMRPYAWSQDEVRDGAEILDWIVSQPWSSGRVGAFGTSYDGTSAEFLVTNGHPALAAAAPRFSVFDVYDDIAYPGGIHLTWFTEIWARYNDALDANELPPRAGLLTRLAVAGVRPVEGHEDQLPRAVADHAGNWDVRELASQIRYRDEPDARGRTADVMSPYTFVDEVEASGTPVYSWSGWFDGGYAHAAIRRHLTLADPRNKLILGPWDHGGRHQVVDGESRPTDFDHAGELLKFLDHHVRGKDTGIERDAPVHYYTLGAGLWRAADTWPPPAELVPFYLAGGGALAGVRPEEAEAFDRYTVDPSHGTGDRSRWNSLMGLPVHYEERSEADAKLLVYDSPPLEADTEVTGHPVMALHVASSARDGAFFVYLEDVAPDGTVTLITEGVLRALHRRLSDETPPYADPVPYRTYRRTDARPLVPDEPAELVFDLLPTSYLFRAGHRIRIALAGADRDHFAAVPEDAEEREPPTWRVFRDAERASHVALPVVERGAAPAAGAPQ